MSRFFSFSLRCLLRIGLVAYFVVGLAYVGVRYGVAPNIDSWRPAIVQTLSKRFGVTLDMERLALGWSQYGLAFSMQAVQLRNAQDSQVLLLPKVKGRLSWRGLLRGSVQFRSLEVDGLQLLVRREADGNLSLLSQSLSWEAAGSSAAASADQAGVDTQHPLVQWLSQQGQVVFRDARLEWRDDTRDGQALVLNQVTAAWFRQGQAYRLAVTGHPSDGVASGFALKARFEQTDRTALPTDPLAWDADFYVRADDMVPDAWRSWADIPEQIASGQINAQWWLTVQQGVPQRMVLDAHLQDGHWRLASAGGVQLQSAKVWMDGAWADYESLAQTQAGRAPVQVQLALQGVLVDAPQVFAQTLNIHALQLQAQVQRDASGYLGIHLDHAQVDNDDMAVRVAGQWREHDASEAGWARLQGHFDHAAMAAIQRYLPLSVEQDARAWMQAGLLQGQVRDADFLLQGELDAFPFGSGDNAQRGVWRLNGRYENAILDYAPANPRRKAWPRLHDMSGDVAMYGADLRLTAQSARMTVADQWPIQLAQVQAHIPNIERQATLTVQGHTQADAGAYLALMDTTPLGGLLNDELAETRAEGRWHVPLQLTIPLLDTDATRVRGQVQFQDGKRLVLNADVPPFTALKGDLAFSEWGVSTHNLSADFLGGRTTLRGGLGKGQKGLAALGKAEVVALGQAFGVQDLQTLSGSFDYHLQIDRNQNGRYGFVVRSDLQGTASRLPAPLTKPTQAVWPTRVAWLPDGKGQAMRLELNIPNRAQAVLWHEPSRTDYYFHEGLVGIGHRLPARGLAKGLALDIQGTNIDLRAWRSVLGAGVKGQASSAAQQRAFLPSPGWLRLRAPRLRLWGLDMDQATLTAQQQAGNQWRLDVASTQTAGTLFWKAADDQIEGKVQAHFARLALDADEAADTAAPTASSDWSLTDELDLPGVQLKVDHLVVAGRHLGSLSLDGVNVARGHLWELEHLALQADGLQLRGHGQWRLQGEERGLQLTAEADISDAGRYLQQLGLDDVLQGGAGTLNIDTHWQDLPWRFAMQDLQGSVRLDLDDGRFSSVQSRSAKVLELLSLQSLQRVFSLDARPGSLFERGFQFDRLSGTLHLKDGVIQSNDYFVDGAAGRVSLAGTTRWDTEALDLQALVTPKLDISGASVAAGLVINPVVGLGALLTQWAFKDSLSRAMAVRYEVKGSWKDPQIREISVSEAEAVQAAHPQASVPTPLVTTDIPKDQGWGRP